MIDVNEIQETNEISPSERLNKIENTTKELIKILKTKNSLVVGKFIDENSHYINWLYTDPASKQMILHIACEYCTPSVLKKIIDDMKIKELKDYQFLEKEELKECQSESRELKGKEELKTNFGLAEYANESLFRMIMNHPVKRMKPLEVAMRKNKTIYKSEVIALLLDSYDCGDFKEELATTAYDLLPQYINGTPLLQWVCEEDSDFTVLKGILAADTIKNHQKNKFVNDEFSKRDATGRYIHWAIKDISGNSQLPGFIFDLALGKKFDELKNLTINRRSWDKSIIDKKLPSQNQLAELIKYDPLAFVNSSFYVNTLQKKLENGDTVLHVIARQEDGLELLNEYFKKLDEDQKQQLCNQKNNDQKRPIDVASSKTIINALEPHGARKNFSFISGINNFKKRVMLGEPKSQTEASKENKMTFDEENFKL